MTTATKPFSTEGDYKVADISLADWGRKELDIAEHEMPGLMSVSYTHLDVYKRQPRACAKSDAQRARRTPRADRQGPHGKRGRAGLWQESHRAHPGGAGVWQQGYFCLLYTSRCV